MSVSVNENPFLSWKFDSFPNISAMNFDHLSAAISFLDSRVRSVLEQLYKKPGPFSWRTHYLPLEESYGRFINVCDLTCSLVSWDRRYAGWEALTDKARESLGTFLGESRKHGLLVARLKNEGRLSQTERHALERDGLVSGLSWMRSGKREKTKLIFAELEELEKAYGANIDASAKDLAVMTSEKGDVAGMSKWFLAKRRKTMKRDGCSGWELSVSDESYFQLMGGLENRGAREMLFKNRGKLASDGAGGTNNRELAGRIVSLRNELATLYKFKSFAEMTLSGCLMTSEKAESGVERAISELNGVGRSDYRKLVSWLKASGIDTPKPWDFRYAMSMADEPPSGGARKKKTDEAFNPPAVSAIRWSVSMLAKCFALKSREFEMPGFPDCLFFELVDVDGQSSFIGISPWAGGNKRMAGGQELLTRPRSRVFSGWTAPVSFVTTDIEVNHKDRSKITLSHSELLLVFHELGHAFHGILGMAKERGNNPRNVEFDGIEFYSYLFEQFAWNEKVICGILRNAGKDAAVSRQAAEKITAGRWKVVSLDYLGAMRRSLIDLRLHGAGAGVEASPEDISHAVNAKMGRMGETHHNKHESNHDCMFHCGYASAVYGYELSESMAIRAYEVWEADVARLGDERAAFEHMKKTIFEPGATKTLKEMFLRYTKTYPSFDALVSSIKAGSSE